MSSPELGTGGKGDRTCLRLGARFQGARWGLRLSRGSQKRQKAGAVFKTKEKMLWKEWKTSVVPHGSESHHGKRLFSKRKIKR